MNISYLKNKNIHFVECEDWHDAYGYEKTEMKEDTINYIEQLQQENKILKENAENNDKVVDKVNWENQLLKKEIYQLKDNWKIIKQYCLDEQIPEEYDEYNSYIEFSNSVYDNILNKMQEIEGSGSNE